MVRRPDEDVELRAEAARSLAFLGSRLATRPLIDTMLTDKEVELRKAAAYALGGLRDKRAFEAMLDVLNNMHEAPEVRGMVAEQFTNLRDDRAIAPLIAALNDPSVEVRFWAAYALGQLGGVEAIPALERVATGDEAVRAPYGSVKNEAAEAITNIRVRLAELDDA